jgi:hypothetical protein
MDRRALLTLIAAATGCAFCPPEAAWATPDPDGPLLYSGAEIELLEEVAETILPRTDTPGAKDAAVGAFIACYSAASHPPEQVALLKAALGDIDTRMRALTGKGFREASGQHRSALLLDIDREARSQAHPAAEGELPHPFTVMKQLTLFGFFTSEAGSTRVARYRPVPGPYKGCTPYAGGETFWAW